jgi:hypothetical protein
MLTIHYQSGWMFVHWACSSLGGSAACFSGWFVILYKDSSYGSFCHLQTLLLPSDVLGDGMVPLGLFFIWAWCLHTGAANLKVVVDHVYVFFYFLFFGPCSRAGWSMRMFFLVFIFAPMQYGLCRLGQIRSSWLLIDDWFRLIDVWVMQADFRLVLAD